MLRTRRTRPLLRQVNGQQHATPDDHEADPASSQPADPSLPPHPIDDVNVDVYQQDDRLIIMVKDNGQGISPDLIKLLGQQTVPSESYLPSLSTPRPSVM